MQVQTISCTEVYWCSTDDVKRTEAARLRTSQIDLSRGHHEDIRYGVLFTAVGLLNTNHFSYSEQHLLACSVLGRLLLGSSCWARKTPFCWRPAFFANDVDGPPPVFFEPVCFGASRVKLGRQRERIFEAGFPIGSQWWATCDGRQQGACPWWRWVHVVCACHSLLKDRTGRVISAQARTKWRSSSQTFQAYLHFVSAFQVASVADVPDDHVDGVVLYRLVKLLLRYAFKAGERYFQKLRP